MSDINSPAYSAKYVANLLGQLSASQARETALATNYHALAAIMHEAADTLGIPQGHVLERAIAVKAREAALRERLEAAEALSVTKILLRVEPDLDGHSAEVYARSVTDVVDELGRIDEALETAEEKLRAAEARIKASQEQEPVAYLNIAVWKRAGYDSVFATPERGFDNQDALYAQPPIHPELAELQRRIVELEAQLRK